MNIIIKLPYQLPKLLTQGREVRRYNVAKCVVLIKLDCMSDYPGIIVSGTFFNELNGGSSARRTSKNCKLLRDFAFAKELSREQKWWKIWINRN